MLYWFVRLLAIGCVLYGAVLTGLVLFENQLLFPGAGLSRGNWTPTEFEFEEVTYQAEDGTKLVSWFLEKKSTGVLEPAGNPVTVLVFHGNAENVSQSAARVGKPLRDYLNANVLVAEYRGYGKSQGSCSEKGILQDAEAALHWLCQRTGKTPDEVILFGHSLGGGPACYLAGKTGCKALVLDRTFDSLVSTAQQIYPIFPIKLMMTNTMRSDLWIRNYPGPLLITHGDQDTLISDRSARNLFELAPSQDKKFLLIKDWGHWDAFPSTYWTEVAGFLENVLIAN